MANYSEQTYIFIGKTGWPYFSGTTTKSPINFEQCDIIFMFWVYVFWVVDDLGDCQPLLVGIHGGWLVNTYSVKSTAHLLTVRLS